MSACSFTEWYSTFSGVTSRSEALPLPPGFADFLVRDSVFLSPANNAVRPAATLSRADQITSPQSR